MSVRWAVRPATSRTDCLTHAHQHVMSFAHCKAFEFADGLASRLRQNHDTSHNVAFKDVSLHSRLSTDSDTMRRLHCKVMINAITIHGLSSGNDKLAVICVCASYASHRHVYVRLIVFGL